MHKTTKYKYNTVGYINMYKHDTDTVDRTPIPFQEVMIKADYGCGTQYYKIANWISKLLSNSNLFTASDS